MTQGMYQPVDGEVVEVTVRGKASHPSANALGVGDHTIYLQSEGVVSIRKIHLLPQGFGSVVRGRHEGVSTDWITLVRDDTGWRYPQGNRAYIRYFSDFEVIYDARSA